MAALDFFSNDFDLAVKSRGRDYFRRRRVKRLETAANSITAAVEGSDNQWYHARVEYNDRGEPHYQCSCPFFRDNGGYPCKHLWAALLQAEQQGVLPAAAAAGPAGRPPSAANGDADDDEDGDTPEDDDGDDDTDAPPLRRHTAEGQRPGDDADDADADADDDEDSFIPLPPPVARRHVPMKGDDPHLAKGDPADWRAQLDRLGQTMLTPRGPQAFVGAWPANRRILYVVDVPATLEGRGLVVELSSQVVKRDGTGERPKQLKIGREQLAALPDADDRQILQMLLGAHRGDWGYYSYYDADVARRFVLPEASYATTFKLMVDTGRARLRKGKEENPPELTWDAGPPWEFWLEFKASPGGRYQILDGSLRRDGGERLALTDTALLLRGGLLFLDGRVAAFDHRGAFDLVAELRDGLKLSVQLAERDDLLRKLLSLPRLPRMDLPADLELTEVRPAPRPRLTIKKPAKAAGNDDRLLGVPSFDYEGQIVDGAQPSLAILSDDARRVLYRDPEAEARHVARLIEAGFREAYDYGTTSGRALRLQAAKLPKVVGELASEGWHVEAEGKVYRQAGQFKVQVKSGIDWFEMHGSISFGDNVFAPLPALLQALRRGDRTVTLDDGTIGLLPEEWLKRYAPLASLADSEEEHLRFSKRQIGFLDALLASMPEATFDTSFTRAREELMNFEGVGPLDPPASFVGELRGYQRDGLGWMQFLRNFGFGGCLADDMGLGKAQPLDAKVLTPGGWKRMGDLAVGDDVIDAGGNTSRVTGVYPQGEREIFRVVFSDGSATECCDEHLWQVTSPVRKYRGAEPRVLPLSEIRQSLTDGQGNNRHFVPMVGPVEFEEGELPLAPYLLGVLLGDGGIAHRVILSSADEELIAEAERLLPAGVAIGHAGHGVDYRIHSPRAGMRNAIADELRGLGLMGSRAEAKFVPDVYKVASAVSRLELLRGLLDTDGHVRPTDNNVEFCSVSRRLAQDVQFLVQSFGGTAPIRTKHTTGQLAYRMSIALPRGINPFRLARKADAYHPREKYPPSRAIVAVEPVGRKPAQCIRVDAPDHLYVTDDFIVTHNTVQVLALLESRRHLRGVAAGGANGHAGNGDTAGANGVNGEAAAADGDPSDSTTQPPHHPTTPAVQGPSLAVVPRSLVFNWNEEAKKFAPGLRVLDHTHAQRQKGTEGFEHYDLVLTTYGTLRRDAANFKDVRFDYVILDEAQAVKNAASESAKAVRLLNADHRLALSGTPVQNHLGELWSLFEFLNPGMMGAASVFKSAGAGSATVAPEARQLLARAIRPFILRRTKEQVAKDLPAKLEQTLFCELEPVQRKLYDELKAHYRTSLLDRIAREGMNKAKIEVLEALLRLRQAACHPGLIDKERRGETSAKLEVLLDHIAEVLEENHKVLVFSQFTSLLSIVRDRLDASSTVYEYLDGKTRDRQARVDRFQNDPDCKLFLISLKAGGLGLNLTAAEYVFLLDPWWNPAVEAQAIDRAHRIGQTRRVFAYRLIAKDTVEEKVIQLQQNKRDLADAIINADNSLIKTLDRPRVAPVVGRCRRAREMLLSCTRAGRAAACARSGAPPRARRPVPIGDHRIARPPTLERPHPQRHGPRLARQRVGGISHPQPSAAAPASHRFASAAAMPFAGQRLPGRQTPPRRLGDPRPLGVAGGEHRRHRPPRALSPPPGRPRAILVRSGWHAGCSSWAVDAGMVRRVFLHPPAVPLPPPTRSWIGEADLRLKRDSPRRVRLLPRHALARRG